MSCLRGRIRRQAQATSCFGGRIGQLSVKGGLIRVLSRSRKHAAVGAQIGAPFCSPGQILVQFLTPGLGPEFDPRFGAAPSSHDCGGHKNAAPFWGRVLINLVTLALIFVWSFAAAAQALSPPLQPPREAILRQLAR